MFLKEEYGLPKPDLVVPLHTNITTAFVEMQLPWIPDVWIHMNSTWMFKGRPKKGMNIVVGVDPHCVNYDLARTFADVFFCMQTPYIRSGDEWLPYAYDVKAHTEYPRNPVTRDAGLIGAPYPNRLRLIEALNREGYNTLFTGYGPAYEEARLLYTTCRVGLNWSTKRDLCARVFEVMAMRLCPIVNRVPDLDNMGWVDGRDYLGFDSVEEALEQMSYAIKGGAWEKIAYQACDTVQGNTWDARVEKVLSYVK
jgi:hypothetical protein